MRYLHFEDLEFYHTYDTYVDNHKGTANIQWKFELLNPHLPIAERKVYGASFELTSDKKVHNIKLDIPIQQ